MNTKNIILRSVTKAMTQYALTLIIVCSSALVCNAQWSNKTNNHSFDAISQQFRITSFNPKYSGGKIHIMWTVIEPTDNCAYIVERSSDNKNFKMIYVKNGSHSPNNIELLHSFVDENPLDGVCYYRIKRLSENETILSAAVRVTPTITETGNSSVAMLSK